MSEQFPDRPNILIIELGNFTIKNLADVGTLFDEAESIMEDYPGNLVIFHLEAIK